MDPTRSATESPDGASRRRLSVACGVYDGVAALAWGEVECEGCDTVADTLSLMGEDFWPYGLDDNRNVLETAARYSFEQGLVGTRIAADDLFVEGSA